MKTVAGDLDLGGWVRERAGRVRLSSARRGPCVRRSGALGTGAPNQPSSGGTLLGFGWLVILATLLLLAPGAHAQSWAERARQMNRTEISATEAVKRSEQGEADRRNKIRIRKIQPAMPSVDWNTDPTAIPYMLYQIGKRTDLPVHIENEGLNTGKDDIFQETVLYLTSHYRWGFNEKENANLTLFLKRGGTLFLDDCYNRGSPFAESVRPEVAKMIVGAEPRVLAQDDVLVKDCFKMIYPTPWPGAAEFENRAWLYFPLDNRPAIFFSPNDDGCGWEISTPPSASNPIGEGIGHGGDNRQRETMYQWMSNWVLFVYTH